MLRSLAFAAYHLLFTGFLELDCIQEGIYTQQDISLDILQQNFTTHQLNAASCQVYASACDTQMK